VSWLIDTNVVAEWVKSRPDERVVRWLAEADEDRLYLSVATLAEVRMGVEALAEGRRKQRLAAWLEDDLPARFEGRILLVDAAVANAWGVVVARARAVGKPLGVMDAFFAATAAVHHLTLVTRNTRDFTSTGIDLLDPWST
jgi:predicted nucleic acid-binding protein